MESKIEMLLTLVGWLHSHSRIPFFPLIIPLTHVHASYHAQGVYVRESDQPGSPRKRRRFPRSMVFVPHFGDPFTKVMRMMITGAQNQLLPRLFAT